MAETTETLASKLTSLDINNINKDEEIVVTIRDDTVIEKIRTFISDNKLVPDVINVIFNLIYQHSCPRNMRVSPSHLLFDEKLVDELLNDIDLDSIPKVQDSVTYNVK